MLDLKAKLLRGAVVAFGICVCLAVIVSVLFLLARDIRKGGEAIGREQATEQGKANVDAINKARSDVRDCRARGGVWNLSEGKCREP